MLKISLLCGAAFLAVGCASAATSLTASQAVQAGCSIEGKTEAGILTVRGLVSGKPGSSGSYMLTVTKSSPGGDTDSRQGGEFAVPASGKVQLGETALNIERGTVVRASMTVRRGAASVSCKQRFSA